MVTFKRQTLLTCRPHMCPATLSKPRPPRDTHGLPLPGSALLGSRLQSSGGGLKGPRSPRVGQGDWALLPLLRCLNLCPARFLPRHIPTSQKHCLTFYSLISKTIVNLNTCPFVFLLLPSILDLLQVPWSRSTW